MRTPLEALFDAMVTGGWANESTGDVESPTGHFARISNAPNELSEIRQAFDDTLTTYGNVSDEDMTGHFLVMTDSQGFIHITRYHAESDLIRRYRQLEDQYADWAGDSEDDSESEGGVITFEPGSVWLDPETGTFTREGDGQA
jgi:hypothetical protein